MTNVNEGNQDPAEILDEETKQALDELEKAGHTVERPDKSTPEPEAPQPEATGTDEPEKPEEKSEETPDDGKPKKEPTLMPRFQHEIAVKRLEKQNSELLAKVEELSKATSEGKSPAEKAEIVDDIEKLAEQHQWDDETKATVQAIVEAAVKKSSPQLPPEVQELINDLPAYKQIKETHQAQAAEQAFNDDFSKTVVPLVEQEYPQISAEHLQTIRTIMRAKAAREDLISTPLSLIYKGLDDFRGIVKTPSKSIDGSRGGQGRNTAIVDFDEMTEEKYAKLSPEDQERYEEYMAEKERTKNKK